MFDTKTFLDNLALTWCNKFTFCQDRINRGLLLVIGGKIAPRGLDSWRVVGTKKKGQEVAPEYTVSVTCGYPSCSCPDFTNSDSQDRTRCKHIWAAALSVRLAEEIERQLMVPVKAPRKPLSNALAKHCQKLHKQNHRTSKQL